MSPAVSVICTFFNAEDTLEATLKSLQGQTAEDVEFLLVDDGSTDRSASIAEAFCAKDRRFVLRRNPVRGRGHALNFAVANASGEYMAVLDADDIAHPVWMESARQQMSEYTEFAVIGFDRVYIGPGEEPQWPADLRVANAPPVDVSARLVRENAISHSGAVIRKERLLAVGGYSAERRGHFDYDLWIRMVKSGHRVGRTNLIRIAKRYHAGQKFAAKKGYFLGSLKLQVQAIPTANGGLLNLFWPAVRVSKKAARALRRSLRP
jgi:glycosyltransferase involved in cell wall biosynthesis